MLTEIVILLFVVVLNGFFAASEMAIVSSRKARLKQRAEEDGDKGAAAALELAEDAGRFIASVQTGITMLSVFAGAYGGAKLSEPLAVYLVPLFGDGAADAAFALVITLVTYISLVAGEIVPKRLGLANAENFACWVARPMQLFAKVGAPIVWFLEQSSNFIIRLLPFSATNSSVVTEEEVRSIIAEGTQTGLFEAAEQQMLEGVLRMGDRSVRAIMTPRQDVVWLDISLPPTEQIAIFMQKDNSRLPVARGKLDEVVGVVYAKDVLKAAMRGETPDLATLAREPLIVHDGMPVLRLVELFRTTRQHLAVVVDEHGSVEGVVSTTDILEAVTGTMPDTGDDHSAEITVRSDGTLLIDAMMPIDELQSRLVLRGMKGDDDDFHTLAGFVLKILGHLPRAGDRFIWEEHVFEVIDMDGRRIDKVLVTIPPSATNTKE